jgi:hypothetical protein
MLGLAQFALLPGLTANGGDLTRDGIRRGVNERLHGAR